MATAKFSGFPADLFRFLRELKANNNRDWFNANKERYKSSVVEPMVAFITAMDTQLAKVSDCFLADPRPHGGSMFRIYRDTRFSHDKRPYKEHVACHFRHMSGKDAHAPGFYVHLEPGNVFFGGGIWHPETPVANQVREAIVADPKGWTKATRSPGFRKRFGDVEGESLVRPPKGFDSDHPLIDDLKRKSFFGVQESDQKLTGKPEFAGEVGRSFVALAPMMEFLTEAVGLSFSLDA
jgi:uncharacterized protein (TIGR02453 family)